jgi:stearoyl-CoA desaturase (Delta-9 desaturase)
MKPSALRSALKDTSMWMFLALHLSCAFVILYPPTLGLVLLAAASYLLRMWAITAGYHRFLAHRSFQTSRPFQFVLALLGATALQNGPLWWVSWHRRHHKYVDTIRDPHSPIAFGFWHSHMGWVFDGKHDKPDLSNVRDLMRVPELRFIEKYNKLVVVAYAVGCLAIAGWGGVVWGFVVSTVLLSHATFCINSLAHVWGSRRYTTDDWSRNNALLAVLTLGEGWHNNHHHYQSSARQGFFWWELDLSYYTIKLLSWLRVVWDVREPPKELLEPASDDHGALPAHPVTR